MIISSRQIEWPEDVISVESVTDPHPLFTPDIVYESIFSYQLIRERLHSLADQYGPYEGFWISAVHAVHFPYTKGKLTDHYYYRTQINNVAYTMRVDLSFVIQLTDKINDHTFWLVPTHCREFGNGRGCNVYSTLTSDQKHLVPRFISSLEQILKAIMEEKEVNRIEQLYHSINEAPGQVSSKNFKHN